MTVHFLVLFPNDPDWAPADFARLTGALKNIGLIGAEREANYFSCGPQYLGLVTYLGCSPQIDLSEGANATTIRLRGIFPVAEFLHGSNIKPPRCRHCRKTLKKPDGTSLAAETLCCEYCGRCSRPHEFDWRRSAAFARVFVEISNVFESEAVPAEELAACLKQASGEVWHYCYVRRD